MVVTQAGRTQITVVGSNSLVRYTVSSRVHGNHLRADFGRRGFISARFKPSGSPRKIEPLSGCVGKLAIEQPGYFRGTLRFVGENRYIKSVAKKAPGVVRYGSWDCTARRAREEEKSDELRAGVSGFAVRGVHNGRFFGVLGQKDGFSTFVVATRSKREGIEIERRAFAVGSAEAYRRPDDLRTAEVRPPWPFSGFGSLNLDTLETKSWRGTLAVSLPGVSSVSLVGGPIVAGAVGVGSLRRIIGILNWNPIRW